MSSIFSWREWVVGIPPDEEERKVIMRSGNSWYCHITRSFIGEPPEERRKSQSEGWYERERERDWGKVCAQVHVHDHETRPRLCLSSWWLGPFILSRRPTSLFSPPPDRIFGSGSAYHAGNLYYYYGPTLYHENICWAWRKRKWESRKLRISAL
jgi:hypothetical protein